MTRRPDFRGPLEFCRVACGVAAGGVLVLLAYVLADAILALLSR